jgi:redox-sensitive bicupin YhaK (pirin superfamily)
MKQLLFLKRSKGKHRVGDGFPLNNVFSYNDSQAEVAPILMLDYAVPTCFGPTNQQRGVGAHPHRAIETVRMICAGEVAHRDSAGAGGTVGPCDLQWMTAVSTLVHEEFRSPAYGRAGGTFEMAQLWVNLRAKDKTGRPGFQGITPHQIPEPTQPQNVGHVCVIAGQYQTTVGAIELAELERAGTAFCVEAIKPSTRPVLIGEPLNEPVVGHGPFVMNTAATIAQAFRD